VKSLDEAKQMLLTMRAIEPFLHWGLVLSPLTYGCYMPNTYFPDLSVSISNSAASASSFSSPAGLPLAATTLKRGSPKLSLLVADLGSKNFG